jgi:hypothetical protein
VLKRQGRSVDDAIQEVNRYHFDYADLSEFELKLKRVIPFYVWTRKNFPLQIENMILQPGKYNAYNHVRNSFGDMGEGLTPDAITSRIASDSGHGIELPWSQGGGRQWLNPDLPFTKTMLDPLEPGGLASMVTPVIKTPVELALGKKAYKGIPISDKQKPAPGGLGWAQIMPFLAAAGYAKRAEGGGYTTNEKTNYAIEQLFPWMADTRRVTPTEERYKARGWAQLWSQLGVPLRANTTYEQQVEEMLRKLDSK